MSFMPLLIFVTRPGSLLLIFFFFFYFALIILPHSIHLSANVITLAEIISHTDVFN